MSENFAVLTSTLLQNMIFSLHKGSHFLVTRVVTFLLICNYCMYQRSLRAEKGMFENHIILQSRLGRIFMV